MKVDVKTLASLLSLSPRTIQKWIASDIVDAQKADKKSYLVESSSLPAKWLSQLPEEYRKDPEKQILLSYCIQGAYHAYLNNPEADAETFVQTVENIVRCLRPLL